jgi:hypothetical protein
MHRLLVPAALAVVLVANSVRAADSPLDPLAWMVGGTWVSELKPAKGDAIAVTMKVEWAAHKKSLKYTMYFKTKDSEFPQYDGVYFWHPGAKEIRLIQTDRSGGVTEAALTLGDGKWTQKNVYFGTDGKKHDQRAELTRDGDDSFRFRAFVPKGEEWGEALNMTYRRVK